MKVLAVGAHPDDFEYGCFGTLALHNKNGDEIYGLTLTKGDKGGDPNIRYDESLEAAKNVNMNLSFGDFKDGMIAHNINTIKFIEDFIKKIEPEIVYTTSIHERHQDHLNVALSMLVAGRSVNQVYAYETISCTNDFHPVMFVDITSTMESKNTALSSHKSQMNRLYMENAELVNQYRAVKIGKPNKAFESFEVIKRVI